MRVEVLFHALPLKIIASAQMHDDNDFLFPVYQILKDRFNGGRRKALVILLDLQQRHFIAGAFYECCINVF